jgi:hypothetical protein
MKLTKLEHACLILDNATGRLIIDPGSFTQLPENLTAIRCIVITEEHADHYNLENIKRILEQSPQAKILTTKVVAQQLGDAGIACEAVQDEVYTNIGDFALLLKEADHAPIYKTSPCRVLTLRIDDFLYYPSDSFVTTSSPVQVLALPSSGPWHKVSEAIDFANSIRSQQILVTHNNLYSSVGNTVTNNFTSSNIVEKDREFVFLEVGETRVF